MNIETAFPNLKSEGFDVTSSYDRKYNCMAWAAGKNDRWWWPGGGFWPLESSDTSNATFVGAFSLQGYRVCEHRDCRPDYEKVAIYADEDGLTHAARQILDGRWTSKLGRDIDITHTLEGLVRRPESSDPFLGNSLFRIPGH
ncbi:MAG: hypothetical protein O3B01_27210, partial [Planctomycetota bacterium]|nr:hypothetical protein [Planctomycetota bacterium]